MKRICIIDSGYRRDDPNLRMEQIEHAWTVQPYRDGFVVTEGAEDEAGHGTAILTILQQGSSENVYTILKIFDAELACEEDRLLYALRYVCEHVPCDLLNLSLGITACTKKKELFELCQRLSDRNTVIVSAFDHSGAVSYPAAFPCVIGVDDHEVCRSSRDIAYVEDSMVNVFAFGRAQRISRFFTRYLYVSGSSVACAHITRALAAADVHSPAEALDALYQMANFVFRKDAVRPTVAPASILPTIKKAIVFPYSKEMHSVVRFDSLLSFSIAGVYDSPLSGNVGRKAFSDDGERAYTVRSWKEIPWESDFDTVILGHLGEYSAATREDWWQKALQFCQTHKKQIYCFDESPTIPPELGDVAVDWPHKDFLPDRFGKLHEITCPVLGIFGTGSKQGKMTLQLILRKLFLSNGYQIGQIGSEPSSLLFGMDDVIPFGYNEKFALSGTDLIEAVNDSLNRIQDKGVDLIIAGCQSGTIPYSLMNIRHATCRQLDFLLGVHPDRVVLCANLFDDPEYIDRTARAIEALVPCRVIAVVLFPMTFAGEYAMIGTPSRKESKMKIEQKKREIHEFCQIPCFELGVEEEMQALWRAILYHFTAGAEG